MTKRVLVTEAASKLIATLKARYGDLMFHQSGGCCDGSQPMCFEKGEFKLGGSDIQLGAIDGCGFYMSRDQYAYWQHTQLTIDVRPLPSARSAAAGTGPQGRLQPPSPLRRMGVQPSASNTVFKIGEAQPFSSSNQNLKSSRPNPSTTGWPESHDTK
jgi:uncharacterized protein (DUF779 family)